MRRFLGIVAVFAMLLSVYSTICSAGPVLPGEEENTSITETYNKP